MNNRAESVVIGNDRQGSKKKVHEKRKERKKEKSWGTYDGYLAKEACHQPQSAPEEHKGNTGVYFLSSSFRFPSLPLSYHTILVSPSRRSQVHDVPYRWYLGLGNGGQVSSQIG